MKSGNISIARMSNINSVSTKRVIKQCLFIYSNVLFRAHWFRSLLGIGASNSPHTYTRINADTDKREYRVSIFLCLLSQSTDVMSLPLCTNSVKVLKRPLTETISLLVFYSRSSIKMEHTEVAQKCFNRLKYIDHSVRSLLNLSNIEYSKEFLDVSKANLR